MSGSQPNAPGSAGGYLLAGATLDWSGNRIGRFLTDTTGPAPILPTDGLWIIDEERGGPGRGFQIEVQGDLLMMVVNGYEPDGRPTFHMAGGTISNGSFAAELNKFAGGMAFGGEPRSAQLAERAGQVSIQFTDRARGIITLPGEPPKAFSKFDFGTPPSTKLSVAASTGMWVIDSELDGNPGRGFLLEAQDNMLVMVFDGYDAAGQPVFYFGAAPIDVFDANVDLNIYAGGTALGSPYRPASLIGSAGQARIHFSTGIFGNITLPGEPPKLIRKFRFPTE